MALAPLVSRCLPAKAFSTALRGTYPEPMPLALFETPAPLSLACLAEVAKTSVDSVVSCAPRAASLRPTFGH